MESKHWTGDDTREFSAPPEPERVDDNELIAELVKACESAAAFLRTVEWNDITSEDNAANVRIELHAAIAKAEQR